ncbi:CDP-alcohol phosphatidyltransferase family protein [Labedaea rhizosphaerae]|uniref:Phosphatidylglycerophosphate synthase n=1 Tax=Labedaea rhizosphaerae TaxID=598644 RepID=A0A4R6S683_LABRH|nr:CDP-alcohol phosphatidyltransferase family protein [Labedaea rhizosphaerae]TDP95191.1 phosphatidylglycerophosphate synthase [Labedaea rhizosphaerae]
MTQLRKTIMAVPAAQLLLLALLTVLGAGAGLGMTGWLAGIGFGLVGGAVLASTAYRFSPADLVTLTRSVLVGCVTALAADHRTALIDDHRSGLVLATFAAVALVLDGVDGKVARRTGTVTVFGARFDMEVDAFLILVLSAVVASTHGWWVLLIGAARYLYVAAGFLFPWLRGEIPPSMARKTVAAIQGVVLAVAASGVLPLVVSTVVTAAALAALGWSFGHDVRWLFVRRSTHAGFAVARPRRVPALLWSTAAVVLLAAAMLAPQRLSVLSGWTALRVPVEGVLALAVLLVLRGRARRVTAGAFGALLGLVLLVKGFDMGFGAELDRPFDPVFDWVLLRPAVEFLAASAGKPVAIAAVVGAILATLALVVLMVAAALRVSRVAGEHRTATVRVLVVLSVIWTAGAATGVQVGSQPVAASDAAAEVHDKVAAVVADVRDLGPFRDSVGVDAFRGVPANQLLTGLRGKDVLLTFVESYGKVALSDPDVDKVLADGTKRLQAKGFQARTGMLTSATFGGTSWLAHSTLQSGLWVNNPQRYATLLTTDRLTLASAFRAGGWRTVSDIPANTRDWSDGKFYGYEQTYDSRNVGYHGPSFSYATMPDQFTMEALQRNELARTQRPPVMAEIDLVTSHNPWTPLPRMVDWSAVGDGSVYDPMPAQGPSKDEVWSAPSRVKAAYAQSIRYSLSTLVSYVETYGTADTVLVFLGDHQPGPVVSGEGASRDVPVTIVAKDPAVLDRIASWHWAPGLRPAPDGPVWRMDAFRDAFFTAFGSGDRPTPMAARDPGHPVAVNQRPGS